MKPAVALARMLAAGSVASPWPAISTCAGIRARRNARRISSARGCMPTIETTIVIRQNPCVDYEANLLYLLIGDERALLIDSGASGRSAPDGATHRPGVDSYLDAAPTGRACRWWWPTHMATRIIAPAMPPSPRCRTTTVVPVDERGHAQVLRACRIGRMAARTFDLGDRTIEVIPTPGHHPDHLVFIDSRTRLLFTGDFLLPGRLLVDDIDAYAHSALRVVECRECPSVSQRARRAHRDWTPRARLYSSGATFHPDERALPLPFATQDAVALRQALAGFQRLLLAASELHRGEPDPQPHRARERCARRRWCCWCGARGGCGNAAARRLISA